MSFEVAWNSMGVVAIWVVLYSVQYLRSAWRGLDRKRAWAATIVGLPAGMAATVVVMKLLEHKVFGWTNIIGPGGRVIALCVLTCFGAFLVGTGFKRLLNSIAAQHAALLGWALWLAGPIWHDWIRWVGNHLK